MNATEIQITKKTLPLTWAAIKSEFHAPALRNAVWAAATTGNVRGLERRIAFSSANANATADIQAVLDAEWAALGFDDCYVGLGDPTVYGAGAFVAYLDQKN